MMASSAIFYFLLLFFFVQSDPEIQFDVICEENGIMGVWKMFERWQYGSIGDMYVSLQDDNCNSTNNSILDNAKLRSSTSKIPKNDNNGTSNQEITLSIITNFSDCNTQILNDTNHIMVVKNIAVLKVTEYLRQGQSKRVFYYNYEMSCQLNRYRNVSTEEHILANSSLVNITKTINKTEEFSFAFSMNFYTDNSFNQTHQSEELTVQTNDMIYVKIKEKTQNDHFKFIVNQCAALPTLTYDASTADVFFDKGCRLDSTFERISNDGATDFFSFQIKVFTFIEEKAATYFHCQLYICKSESDASNCQQRCQTTNLRQRRDVSGVIQDAGEVMISSKKIVFNKKITCADILCSFNSSCYPLEPARCICNEGYVFSRVMLQCSPERHAEVTGVHLDQPWNPNLADPQSRDFIELAVKYEDLLYKTIIANDKTGKIEGVRIISAREGSIILDVKIMYANTTKPEVAYEAFVESLTSDALPGTTARKELNIITDRKPILKGDVEDENTSDDQKLILSVVIVLLLAGVLILMLAIFIVRRRRQRTTKQFGRFYNFELFYD